MTATGTATFTQDLLDELETEGRTTRRMLERVPADQLSWRPHPKSMSLGQLALHTAKVPGGLAGLLSTDGFDVSQMSFNAPMPADREEILSAHDTGLSNAEEFLRRQDGPSLEHLWAMTNKEQTLFALPRAKLVRSLMFNHWYHHRGQLAVYLRLLDVPVPASYGPSADENPFAARPASAVSA